MNDLIAQYLDCWNETDPAARRKLIDGTWAADASYIDPLAEAHGRDAIDATIAAAQAQFPGFVFSLAGPSRRTTSRPASPGAWVPRAPSRRSSASTWPSPATTASSSPCSASWTKYPPERGRQQQQPPPRWRAAVPGVSPPKSW